MNRKYNNQLQAFIDGYSKKDVSVPTVLDMINSSLRPVTFVDVLTGHNKRLNRTCPSCSHQWDARLTGSIRCSNCGTLGR